MRRLLLVLGWMLVTTSTMAQSNMSGGSGGGSGLSFVASTPATCTPGVTASVQLSGSPYGIYYCIAANTWASYAGNCGAPPAMPNGVSFTITETPSGGLAQPCAYSWSGVNVNAQTGASYTIAATDRSGIVTDSNAGATAITLPQAGTTNFANSFNLGLFNIGVGLVTITPTTSTINGNATQIVPNHWASYIYTDPLNNYRAGTFPDIAAFPNCVSGALNFTSATGVFSCNANPIPSLYFSSTMWGYAKTAAADSQVATTNSLRACGFYLPIATTFSKIDVSVGTGDNSANLYSFGIYNSSGTLVAHTAPASYTTSGFKDISTVEGSQTLAGGKYYFGFTGNAAVLALQIADVFFASFMNENNTATVTAGGAQPASFSPAADSWAESTGCYIFQMH